MRFLRKISVILALLIVLIDIWVCIEGKHFDGALLIVNAIILLLCAGRMSVDGTKEERKTRREKGYEAYV